MRIWPIRDKTHPLDVVTLAQAAQMLGVGIGAAARLVRAGEVRKGLCGRSYLGADVRRLATALRRSAL